MVEMRFQPAHQKVSDTDGMTGCVGALGVQISRLHVDEVHMDNDPVLQHDDKDNMPMQLQIHDRGHGTSLADNKKNPALGPLVEAQTREDVCP